MTTHIIDIQPDQDGPAKLSAEGSKKNDLGTFFNDITSTALAHSIQSTTADVGSPIDTHVFIVTSYKNQYVGLDWLSYDRQERSNVTVNLGRTIQDFSGVSSGNGRDWDFRIHDNYTQNNAQLNQLYSRLSASDRNLNFSDGQAYVIGASTGRILGVVGNHQVNGGFAEANKSSIHNTNFSVVSGLGVTHVYDTNEEGMGGRISLNGRTYEVTSTVVRKETPLVFDTHGAGDGVQTTEAVTRFDINGDGTLDSIHNVDDAILTIRGGSDGRDLFGNNTDLDGDGKADGYKDGFEALKALALKEGLAGRVGDMTLDRSDLAVLEEKYQLAFKTGGYNGGVVSLESMGITKIELGVAPVTLRENFDGRSNDVLEQQGATFTMNGVERQYADVLHTLHPQGVLRV